MSTIRRSRNLIRSDFNLPGPKSVAARPTACRRNRIGHHETPLQRGGPEIVSQSETGNMNSITNKANPQTLREAKHPFHYILMPWQILRAAVSQMCDCLLYTSDAADD